AWPRSTRGSSLSPRGRRDRHPLLLVCEGFYCERPGSCASVASGVDCSRSLDLSQEALLLIVGQKAGDEGIARERSHFRFLRPECGGGLEIVVDDVSAEVCRIVGVDGGHDSSLQQRAQRMILHRAENPQLHIRQRTNRERNAPGG